jgi:glycyl-tRNA synthetase beta chain
MLDRLRGMLKDSGHAIDVIEAVLAQRPTRIDLVPAGWRRYASSRRCPKRWRWPRPTSGSATS